MSQFETTKDLLDYIDSIDELEYANDKNTDHFKISSIDQANYYVKKYKELEEEYNNINQSAKDCLEEYSLKVDKWRENSINPIINKMDYYKNLLEEYAHNQLDNSKKKSLKLIEGIISFRAQQPIINYDEETMINYLKEHNNNCLRTTFKVDKKELKSLGQIKDNNFYFNDQLLDFVNVENTEPTFSIK